MKDSDFWVAVEDLMKYSKIDLAKALANELYGGKKKGKMLPGETLTELDVWMAKFALDAYQSKSTGGEELLNDYRLYLQGKLNYNKLIDNIYLRINYQDNPPVLPEVKSLIKVAAAMPPNLLNLDTNDQEIVGEMTNEEVTKAIKVEIDQLSFEDQQKILRQIRQQAIRLPKGSQDRTAVKEALFENGFNYQPDKRDKMLGEIQRDLGRLMQMVLEVAASQERNPIDSPELFEIKDNLIQVKKMQKDVLDIIEPIHTETLNRQGFTDVSWYDLPKKVKLWYTRGLKNVLLSAISAPITIVKALLGNVVKKSLVTTVNVISSAIQVTIGVSIIIMVCGGTAYLLYGNWTVLEPIVTSTPMKWGYAYATIFIKKGFEYLPSTEVIIEGWRIIGRQIGNDIYKGLLLGLEYLQRYLNRMIVSLMCKALQDSAPWPIKGTIVSWCSSGDNTVAEIV